MFKKRLENFSNYTTPQIECLVKADANENLLELHEELKDIILDTLKNSIPNLCFYPEINSQPLKEALAKFYNLKSENFIVGNGSDQIIQLIVQACCDQDDHVFFLYPSFTMYRITAELFDVGFCFFDITSQWKIDVEKVIAKISANERIKVIFIDTPNNPTGIAWSAENLKTLVEAFPSKLIVIDNAYGEYSDIDYIEFVRRYNNTIILKTFSKIGFAGIRCGYGIANENIIKNLHKVKPPYNVNVLTQNIAIKVLENFEKLKDNIQLIKDERDRMIQKLKEYYYVIQSEANFVTVVDEYADRIFEYLVAKKILVKKFEVGDKKLLRITLGKPQDNDIITENLIRFKKENAKDGSKSC
ncbi:histidinol-phosphate aminotransferase [Caldicellulosiruptor kronotskyensis 2002]|uniref:Histidinol-phosphate aminotransferase n=1 Tax=Caldicellulosiruptor kronotskyensis (strain DSM 18902 / VKM B-2412 / 2002) TaxID=632348 RepID=E4SBH1_CALK2|nr:histidinol-phosphate transaminase [Caldicellulosiruptor kronotskyensis]ADQ46094.1 histidinol-phosphate aminotransferase [Caldicellulosiruptor kronotskyensis 2002]